MAPLEADSQIEVPRSIGGEIKAMARQYPDAFRFVCEELCRARRLSYVPGLGDARDTMIWFEGRRFVGEQLQRIVDAPMPEVTPPEPRAVTMAQKQARRARRPRGE